MTTRNIEHILLEIKGITMRKQNYLNNKDMLKEIHKSKLSFCSVIDDDYTRFDVIVEDIEHIKNKSD